MNIEICKKCKRYVQGIYGGNTWGCAKECSKRLSFANKTVYVRDNLVPIVFQSDIPEWCEFPLEQVITESGEQVNLSHNYVEKGLGIHKVVQKD